VSRYVATWPFQHLSLPMMQGPSGTCVRVSNSIYHLCSQQRCSSVSIVSNYFVHFVPYLCLEQHNSGILWEIPDLFHLCYYTKIPGIQFFKNNRNLYSNNSGGWKVQDHSVRRFGIWWKPAPLILSSCVGLWHSGRGMAKKGWILDGRQTEGSKGPSYLPSFPS
jgi:hypothetical protein